MSTCTANMAVNTTGLKMPLVALATALIAALVVFVVWRWSEDQSDVCLISPRNPEACRKLGMTGRGNLADEYNPKYARSQPDQTLWKVKSLWIYPIKSCKGVELETAVTVGAGMEYDRQFAFARFVDVSKPKEEKKMGWKFITQREFPLLANIKPEIWVPDCQSNRFSTSHRNVQSSGVLVIKYPATKGGREKAVEVPYAPTQEQIELLGFRTKSMKIWIDSPDAIMVASTDNGDGWIEEVKAYLEVKTPLALFRVKDMHSRELFRCAPREEVIGFQPSVGFQDAYPLHLLNLASVQDVANRFKGGAEMLSARNFRPNIIIAGGDPYAEDSWKRIRMGDDCYYTSCRTVRCRMPNVSQDTGEKADVEPDKTLRSFRCIDGGDKNNACLGMQMVPAVEEARTICVGDEITVLETGEHFYIKQSENSR